jgi:hypothetical protein
MYPPMQEMSFWQLVRNSPEWVSVSASALFALVTIGVVIWQVIVMKRQGRTQNRLIRLQHEHEWLLRSNAVREQVLKLSRKLHLAAGCLKETPSGSDQHFWEEVKNTVYELDERLNIVDLDAYSGAYDHWFLKLKEYIEAVQKAVFDDGDFDRTYSLTGETPNLSTRKALKDADDRYKPISIFLDLEAAIRMEFFEFKSKWDTELRDGNQFED